jgi:hypothetical protein
MSRGPIYRISTMGAEKILYRLSGYEGKGPSAPLLEVNGMLYGTTASGGSGSGYGYGTVFIFTP